MAMPSRLAPNDTIKAVLVETADNLCARFNPEIGCIRSWDFGAWNFPVIIDNMMNLDLLFNVYKLTGDEKYKNVAVKHAQTTMKNHFRPDYTSYHVVSYNNDGSVEIKQTHQGKNAESAWSRGQAWGVYGYTSCYRETRDTAFLQEAVHIADMIMERVKTDDLIPTGTMMPRQVKRLRVMRLPRLSRHRLSWSSAHLHPTAKNIPTMPKQS